MTYTPIPVWPRPTGGGGSSGPSNLATEADTVFPINLHLTGATAAEVIPLFGGWAGASSGYIWEDDRSTLVYVDKDAETIVDVVPQPKALDIAFIESALVVDPFSLGDVKAFIKFGAGPTLDAEGDHIDGQVVAGGVSLVGTGLFLGINNLDTLQRAIEGTLDRSKTVSSFSTIDADIDLVDVVGNGEVVTQPTLEGGVPIRGSRVWLFNRTDPAENGCYRIMADTPDAGKSPGEWVKEVHPNVFNPRGNGYMVVNNNPGATYHGTRFYWMDADRTKDMRVVWNADVDNPEDLNGGAIPSTTGGSWARFDATDTFVEAYVAETP